MGTFWLDAKSTISINRENGRKCFQERPPSSHSQELLARVPGSASEGTGPGQVSLAGPLAAFPDGPAHKPGSHGPGPRTGGPSPAARLAQGLDSGTVRHKEHQGHAGP